MSNSYAAIGDVHGRIDLLRELVDKVRLNHLFDPCCPAGSRKRFVLLGDYIDRGPNSNEVIEWLIRHQAGLIILPGNHELMMAEALQPHHRRHSRSFFDAWVNNGGDSTIRAYLMRYGDIGSDMDSARLIAAGPDAVVGLIPTEHLEYLEYLAFDSPPYHLDEEHKLLFVHAAIRPHKPLLAHSREELLWSRDPLFLCPADPGWKDGWRVVHGHTIDPSPTILPHRVGLDTGAFWTDRLTCAVFEPEKTVSTVTTNRHSDRAND